MRPSLGEAFMETSIHNCSFPQNPLLTRLSRQKSIEIPIAKPASAANASGLVQILLSQVRRRKTVCSTRLRRAGVLVDKILRFIINPLLQTVSKFQERIG